MKTEVISTDNSNLRQYRGVLEGDQRVEARIPEGPFKGRAVWADNLFPGKLFKAGDKALVAPFTALTGAWLTSAGKPAAPAAGRG